MTGVNNTCGQGRARPRNQHKKYVPHLAQLQAVCATNYGLLLRLLPELDESSLRYEFTLTEGQKYVITIVLCETYTTTVDIHQFTEGLPEYLQPEMQVRLYHDAKMAEVLSFQSMNRFKPSYQYPNQLMHQKNEKEMVNLFLFEWLEFCRSAQRDIKQ